MWMMDHIANNELNEAFRTNYARIPLTGGATILHGDALEIDWADLLPPQKCSFVMGNPPFVGAKFQSEFQRAQMRRIARLGGSGGTLDYVAAWFVKAAEYLALPPKFNDITANSEQRTATSEIGSASCRERVCQYV